LRAVRDAGAGRNVIPPARTKPSVPTSARAAA